LADLTTELELLKKTNGTEVNVAGSNIRAFVARESKLEEMNYAFNTPLCAHCFLLTRIPAVSLI
jgi:hypothetical protein